MWGVVFVVAMTTFMPVIGINQGVQPIIGYNYGAERYDRVKRALQLAVCRSNARRAGGLFRRHAVPGVDHPPVQPGQ